MKANSSQEFGDFVQSLRSGSFDCVGKSQERPERSCSCFSATTTYSQHKWFWPVDSTHQLGGEDDQQERAPFPAFSVGGDNIDSHVDLSFTEAR